MDYGVIRLFYGVNVSKGGKSEIHQCCQSRIRSVTGIIKIDKNFEKALSVAKEYNHKEK